MTSPMSRVSWRLCLLRRKLPPAVLPPRPLLPPEHQHHQHQHQQQRTRLEQLLVHQEKVSTITSLDHLFTIRRTIKHLFTIRRTIKHLVIVKVRILLYFCSWLFFIHVVNFVKDWFHVFSATTYLLSCLQYVGMHI